jgi:hypothetical protein
MGLQPHHLVGSNINVRAIFGILATLAWLVLGSASPQVLTSGAQSPAIAAGGDLSITYGLSPEQVEELTKAAAAASTVSPLPDKIVDLSKRLGVTEGAVTTMLRIIIY